MNAKTLDTLPERFRAPIKQMFEAIRAGDWVALKSAVNCDFANDEAMKESFDQCVVRMKNIEKYYIIYNKYRIRNEKMNFVYNFQCCNEDKNQCLVMATLYTKGDGDMNLILVFSYRENI